MNHLFQTLDQYKKIGESAQCLVQMAYEIDPMMSIYQMEKCEMHLE
jgi:hypothetical protein